MTIGLSEGGYARREIKSPYLFRNISKCWEKIYRRNKIN